MDTRPAIRPLDPFATPSRRLALAAYPDHCRSAEANGQRIALATQRLIALGHRRILLVTPGESPIAELQAHSQVMLAEGLPLLPCMELDPAAILCWPELAIRLHGAAPTALLCTQAALVRALQSGRYPGALPTLTITGPEARTRADRASWH
jgi:hypothetical protein